MPAASERITHRDAPAHPGMVAQFAVVLNAYARRTPAFIARLRGPQQATAPSAS